MQGTMAGSVGRHPRDLLAMVVATGVVVLCSLAAQVPVVNPVEVAIFEQFERIPPASVAVWGVLALLGGWPGIAAVSALMLYLKKIGPSVQCAAAGVLAWGISQVLSRLISSRPVPDSLLGTPGVRLPGPAGFEFLASHPSVAAAMAAVAAPYFDFGYRAAAWVLVVLVAASDVYLGNSLPLGAFAAVFLGWAVGAAFRLACGAPGRKTSDTAVWRALEAAGLTPSSLVPIQEHLLGPLAFALVTDRGERLRVDLVRRLHRRAGPWYRLRRLLASVETEDEPPLTSTYHEVEHAALVSLFAQRAGVRTPSIVLTCETRHGAPLLVSHQIEGRRLTELSDSEIDEAMLDAVWAQIAALGEARIAHHDLQTRNVLVDRDRNPWLLNMTFGKIGASTARIAQDVAEALVSLASRVGVARAVRGACRTLSPDRLEPALVYLQPLALPRRIRGQLGRERYALTDLRETLAEQIDRPIPTFRSPLRPRAVAGLLLLGAAVYTLLPQLSSMRAVLDSLGRANEAWLAVATLTGLLSIPLAALSVIGSSPRPLPFWRTTAVQMAAAFTGRTTPGGVGFFGINIAFLERLGVRRSRAVGVLLLNVTAAAVVAALLCVIGVFAVGASGLLANVRVPLQAPVLAAAAGVLVCGAAVLFSPYGRRRFVRPGLRVAAELVAAVRQPVRATQLLTGTIGSLVVPGLGLAACLAAFDVNVSVLVVITVFVIGQTLGHIAPIPGGLGAVEALMVAGLTAVGTPSTLAVATVLTMRVLTYWLPVLPGIVTFRYLQHHNIV